MCFSTTLCTTTTMTRKEFIKICGLLGIVVPFHTSCVTSSLINHISSKFEGKVIIIGAGAGGLSAGYLLDQLGIDFEILENILIFYVYILKFKR